MNVIVQELTLVSGAVSPSKVTVAVLLSIDVVSLVLSTIRPGLFAPSMLFVLLPLAFVLGAIGVHVLAVAVRLVVAPLAFIDIAVSMNQATRPVGLVVAPEALVKGAVCPDLCALPIALQGRCIPLSLVLGPVFKDLFLLCDASYPVIGSGGWVDKGAELSADVLNFLVVIVILSIFVIQHVRCIVGRHRLRNKAKLLLHSPAGERASEEGLNLDYDVSVLLEEIGIILGRLIDNTSLLNIELVLTSNSTTTISHFYIL